MDDAGAELRLRGEEFPTHLVASEVEQLRNSVKRVGPVSPSAEFVRKFDEFIRDMNKLKHQRGQHISHGYEISNSDVSLREY